MTTLSELLHNHIFLLLVITLLGMLLGRLRLKSFALGSSAIIFVALVFGHYSLTLPDDFQTLGLVLFIYSIGLQAGPGFFHTLRDRGIKLALGALAIIAIGFLTTLLVSHLYGFDSVISAGLFAGALTSTPGLAVAVESAGAGASAAYGLTYFFGVTGVILFIQLLPKVLGIDIGEEEKMMDARANAASVPLAVAHIELTNPNIFGKKVADLHLNAIAPVVITRLLRKGAGEPVLVRGETELGEKDHLRLVGRQADLDKVCIFLGRPIDSEISFDKALEKRQIIVSRREMVGMSLKQLNCREVFHVQISRLTRNGIDLPATPNIRLHMGDLLHVVGESRSLVNVTKIFGNNTKELYSISLLPIFIGLLCGFLLGKVPLYIPLGGAFTLGTTGGVLIAGIILSNLYKTGPIIWEIPSTANTFLRELGLILFMATVGTKTGATIVTTLSQQGLNLFLAGLIVTLIPLVAAVFICRYLLGMPFLRMLGVITGAMTSTPGLAAASEMSASHYASSAYATVYPVALIGMILFSKLLVAIQL
ncbi:MAG: aspartate:alanine exchanger family transporter [Desulfopila sp.]